MDKAKQEYINNNEWSLVTDENTESFLQELSNSWPASLQIHNFIKSCLLWSTSYPHIKTTIFHKLSKDQESIIAMVKAHEIIITAYSSNGPDMDIATALRGNDIVNWSEGPILMTSIPLELSPSIKEAMSLSGKRFPKDNTFNTFWLPADAAKAFEVKCPEDMYLSKLDPDHAATVIGHWPYTSENSLGFVTQMINVHDTVGLFTKKDSLLVSWALYTFYGVGMLHTLGEYRRKGYGTLVVQELVKTLGNRGINPNIMTLTVNHAAESLFMKIGFKKLEPVVFMRVYTS